MKIRSIKKSLKIVLTLLTVICIVYILIDNLRITRILQTSDNLDTKLMEATKIESITNWKNRVNSYASRLGRYVDGAEEQKWLWTDTQKVYKDLYCVQSGNSHSTSYDVYDLYNIDSSAISKYFSNEDNYKHFMWILENMYVSNISDSTQRSYMETQLLNKLGSTATTQYNAMPSELLGFYTNAGVTTTGGTNMIFYLYKYDSTQKKTVKTDNTITVNTRENFIRTIQNYVLLHHVVQRSGTYDVSPLDSNGNITLSLRTYSNDGSQKCEDIDNTTNSKKFAHALVKYLENGYDSTSYNINKYKNFSSSSYNGKVIINKTQASYDATDYKIGPFYITNEYGFEVNIDTVKIGSNSLTNYKIVDENGNTIDLSSENTNNKEFYLKFDNDVRSSEANELLKVSYSVDYGDVPTARIFVPTGGGENPQTLINVSRTHTVESGTWSETVESIKPDIALKKYIYQINGTDVEDRLIGINTSTISESHNATYNMVKTPISVNVGDTVTYVIQLFNEGNVDGRASQIVDYLPDGLEVIRVYGNDKEASFYNQNGKAILIANPYDTYISAFNGENGTEFEAKSQKIYVECKVVGRYEGIYTNVAEIQKYDFANGDDIDSSENNWKIPSSEFVEYWNVFAINKETDRQSDEWKNYSNNQENWLDGQFHPFVGQEDDDDFEKIKVNTFDLALTKSIAWKYDENGEKVPLSTENSEYYKTRLVVSGEANVVAGFSHDLSYNMNKEAAQVVVGDKVVSRIRVYNEGQIDGIVKEVTDYMPKGLKFLETETINENSDTYSYTYNESTNILQIRINGDEGTTIGCLTEGNTIIPEYIEITVVCEVTEEANGILFNSAAITQYGYMDGTEYVQADKENVDIDSYQTVLSSSILKSSHKNKWNNKSVEALGTLNKSELQVEDDDDVDCIEVVYKPEFDLALRKNIYKVDKKLRSKSICKN